MKSKQYREQSSIYLFGELFADVTVTSRLVHIMQQNQISHGGKQIERQAQVQPAVEGNRCLAVNQEIP